MNTIEHRYSATSPNHGELILDVCMEVNACKAKGSLLDVIVCQAFEALTQSLEDTAQHPIEWNQVTGTGNPSNHETFEIKLVFDPQSLIEHASLHIPASLIERISKHQFDSIEGIANVSWQRVACTLCLSELTLSPDEQNNLHDGALLIIPESFQPVWNSGIRLGKSVHLAGKYLLGQDSWTNDSANVFIESNTNENRMNGEGKTTHCVEFPCQLNPHDLMHSQGNPMVIGLSVAQQGAVLNLKGIEGTQYQGSLVPIGKGQAMLLKPIDAQAANT